MAERLGRAAGCCPMLWQSFQIEKPAASRVINARLLAVTSGIV